MSEFFEKLKLHELLLLEGIKHEKNLCEGRSFLKPFSLI